MDKFKIIGSKPLCGSINISGSKNAALPILISTLLTEAECKFTRIPQLQDIHTVLELLSRLGVTVKPEWTTHTVSLCAKNIHTFDAPYDLVSTMRASVLALGPLVARFGQARVSLPGGCAIGARPIGFHLSGLEKLGAEISMEAGYVIARARRLQGSRIVLDFPSVGATENLMMAASLASGETMIKNAAKEPEIVNLADALKKMGASITGAGSDEISIQGKSELKGCEFEVIGDRIEAGTFLVAGFGTGGEITVQGIGPTLLESVLVKLEESGAKVFRGDDYIQVHGFKRPLSLQISTQPYPGFPTDMQAQFMSLMSIAEGTSTITENIFENRFMHVPEICRLGAEISVHGNTATVRGQSKLVGAPVMATDLRASASLILGGLFAQGETLVNRVYHLDRGYEAMEKKMAGLGASVERIR